MATITRVEKLYREKLAVYKKELEWAKEATTLGLVGPGKVARIESAINDLEFLLESVENNLEN